MLYPEIFKRFERDRWTFSNSISWDLFDRTKISDGQLYGVKMNAILEWSAMPTAEMFLRDNQGDTDFSAFLSIWFYEEQKHSLVLMEYLRRFAPDFLPTENELSQVRFSFDSAPPLESLVLHFCGEVRLNQWYRCANEYHAEPVIKSIYKILANDEARHARAYYDYMSKAMNINQCNAQYAFSKIGTLMTNPRLNKAMHPTNLHVNNSLYPNDTVNSKLPDPDWLERWLNNEIGFNYIWEERVNKGIFRSLSAILDADIQSSHDLLTFKKSISNTITKSA